MGKTPRVLMMDKRLKIRITSKLPTSTTWEHREAKAMDQDTRLERKKVVTRITDLMSTKLIKGTCCWSNN